MMIELDRSSFEICLDPSTGLTSIDDPSINLSDPSDRQPVFGYIYPCSVFISLETQVTER
ncbi:hypothetical protein HanIR_Chr13g0618151 [Helianthus annuus]|nr:hypothetical protein HanIR_Chr13g0618151 [Helianthus annuus]